MKFSYEFHMHTSTEAAPILLLAIVILFRNTVNYMCDFDSYINYNWTAMSLNIFMSL